MGKLIDITNHKYGKWLVIERDFLNNKKGNTYWKCIDEQTGDIKSISKSNLIKHEELVLKNKNISYIVYKHTSPSGKSYIGITSNKPEARWGKNGGGYLKSECHSKFNKAILKYGWENFTHDILESGITHRKAQDLEIYYIKKYDSYFNGYNATLGGEHSSFLNKKHSERTKKILSDMRKGKGLGKDNPNYGNKWNEEQRENLRKINTGKHLSEETKKKISITSSGENNGMYGKKHSQDSIVKNIINQKTRKEVICDNIIFMSLTQCAKYYNIDVTCISAWLNQKTKMPYDFYKLGLRFNNDTTTEYEFYKEDRSIKKIVCDDIIYDSRKEFSLHEDIKYSSVRNWFNINIRCKMPQKYIDRGLRYYNPLTDADLPIYQKPIDNE